MARFTLHAVAPNRSGIVAAVTQSLAEIGCNLEDSRMCLLHGQFSIVLVLDAPSTSSGTAIEMALAPHLEELALQLFVRPIAEEVDEIDLHSLVSISVQGADHPGTVARIAHAITTAGGNIVDLVGHVAPEDVEAPSHLELTAELEHDAVPGLQMALDALVVELGMRCEVREAAARPG
jgi:glycine cleavage system transcriptional repressor